MLHSRVLQQIRRSSTSIPKAISIPEFLRVPTWSVSSLVPPEAADASPSSSSSSSSASASADSPITREKLHHLLRLSALPPPATPEAEKELLASLHAHLHFVRAVQAVDTKGVAPLARVEDEVERPRPRWKRITKASIRRKRFERGMKEQGRVNWEPMPMAKKVVGGFYVVDEKVTEELDLELEEGGELPTAEEVALPKVEKV